jgi:CubicO group peptidase (beta-lactamase class C family)
MTEQQLLDSGFESVAAAFSETLVPDQASGAALSIWLDGHPVVELWGGTADARTKQPYGPSTLDRVYSCTKGVASVLVGRLIQQGLLPSLDTPVSDLWPEFAAHGKGNVSIGDALAYRAGLSAPRGELPRDEALNDMHLADALAAQEPLWEPGTHHMYHSATHGALTAKLVRIATGLSIGSYLAAEAALPLDADVHIGLPAREDHRLSALVMVDLPEETPPTSDPEALHWVTRARDVFGPFSFENLSDPALVRHELAGMGGVATASGLAKFWSATVTVTDGIRLIDDDMVAALSVPRSSGPGYFAKDGLPPFQAWGAGVMVPSDWTPYLSPRSFGHDGAGGQVAFADPTPESVLPTPRTGGETGAALSRSSPRFGRHSDE